MDRATYEALRLDRSFVDDRLSESVNGRAFFVDVTAAMTAPGDAAYHPCAEAIPDDTVPRGSVEHVARWSSDAWYAGTTRDVWYSVTPGADEVDDVNLVVLNDGGWYVDPAGPARVPAVLDSLTASGDLTPTLGVYVGAGVPAGAEPGMGDLRTFVERSVEYDTCDDTYVSFVEAAVLPMIEARAGVRLSTEPSRRVMGGISSGGICAFTAAWHRPDLFGCVLSHCGSFTNLRGGHHYPYLVRTTARKQIRAFLQSCAQDLDTVFGNWPLANHEMASALAYAGYEHRFEFGSGGHSLAHGGALLAESLRWLLA